MRANTGSVGVWSIAVRSASPAAAASGRSLVDAVLRTHLQKSVDLHAEPDGPTALHWAADLDDLDTTSSLTHADFRSHTDG